MRYLYLLLFLTSSLFSFDTKYVELSKNIIRELNYIFQERSWTGGSTFKKGRRFTYNFKSISDYEIEITRNIDGVCLDAPFIIDLREEYFIELQADDRCDPALIISHELDIVYLYVKDRCGNFGGFNLYKRAQKSSALLKAHFYEAYRLNQPTSHF